eukprot:425015_1
MSASKDKNQEKKTPHKKKEYDTSFYSIRRAHPKDLPQIIDVIISEPYFRWKELLQLMLSNIYVTVTWFVGAILVMLFGVLYLVMSKNTQYTSRSFYIGLAICSGLLIFGGCYAKAFSLYFVRYIRAFTIRAELQKMDEKTFDDNAAILKNETVHLFWQIYNFYIAEPYDEPSSKICLGVIAISSYKDYCKEKQITDKDFEVIVKAIPDGFALISHKTIVISWLVVNEKFFKDGEAESGKNNNILRDSVYCGLLRYVNKNVIEDTSINYAIAECDDFVYWQHDILMENKYGFCGERVDLIWEFYHGVTQEGYPNNKYFFIKVCNIDEKEFKRRLEIEKRRREKEMGNDKDKKELKVI